MSSACPPRRNTAASMCPPTRPSSTQYAREMMAGCGKMILGSDSHTRYGALGTMGVGEGGPEIVKQLLKNTYDIAMPEVVLVYLTGTPRQRRRPPRRGHRPGAGAVYENGFVKNKVLEFAGPGIASLPMDYRIGIDVMTTETACLSSIWETDEDVRGLSRASTAGPEDYQQLAPERGRLLRRASSSMDLSTVEPMVALPFHPSEAVTLRELHGKPRRHPARGGAAGRRAVRRQGEAAASPTR